MRRKSISRRVRVLTASEVRVVDAGGAVRGRIMANGCGPWVYLYGEGGRAQVKIGVAENGDAGVMLLDSRGETSIWIGAPVSGEPVVAISDTESEVRARLGLQEQGAYLSLSNADGKPQIFLAADNSGAALITCERPGESRTVELGVGSDGAAGIWVARAGDRVAAMCGVSRNGTASVLLRNRHGRNLLKIP